MQDTIIEASGLSVKIGHRFILSNITWTVPRGEHWVVFGLNGSGKTTLLSIIAGFKEPTGGSIRVFGKEFTQENILDQRKRIGWVSASFYDKIYTRESVLDIVLSGLFGTLGVRGEVKDADIVRANLLLGELNMGDKIDRSFATLSKGERQNVMLARAFMSKPELLILDEPCNGLDICSREHLFSIINDLAQDRGITMVYVTHYVDEILAVFQNALFLRNGMDVAHGRTDEVFSSESFSSLVGQPVVIQPHDGRGFKAYAHVPSHITSIL